MPNYVWILYFLVREQVSYGETGASKELRSRIIANKNSMYLPTYEYVSEVLSLQAISYYLKHMHM